MEWTQQKLNLYLGRVRTVVEFEGITGKELEQVFRKEAMRRLQQIEGIVMTTDLTDREKVDAISKILS